MSQLQHRFFNNSHTTLPSVTRCFTGLSAAHLSACASCTPALKMCMIHLPSFRLPVCARCTQMFRTRWRSCSINSFCSTTSLTSSQTRMSTQSSRGWHRWAQVVVLFILAPFMLSFVAECPCAHLKPVHVLRCTLDNPVHFSKRQSGGCSLHFFTAIYFSRAYASIR